MVKLYRLKQSKRAVSLLFISSLFTSVLQAQNVGIGTNTPTTNLHIEGGASAGLLVTNINGVGQSQIEIKSSTTPNQSLFLLHFNAGTGGTIAGLSLSGASIVRTGINNTGSMIMGTSNNAPVHFISNNTRRMTLSENGALALGGANPSASAQLDIQGTTGGLLIPRLSTAQRNAIASPANGLMVYNTTTNNLNYFKTGDGWTEVGTGGGGNGWLTTGNFDAPANAVLGTYNQAPLRFVVLGQNSGMFWYDAEANTFAGFASGVVNQTGNNNNRANTGFGTSTLTGLSTGERNTAVGTEAGFSITTGSRNVYLGRQASYMHNTQSGNVAIGSTALYHRKGNDNIAIGDSAYFGGATGVPTLANIAIGKNAFRAATTAAGNVVVGREAMRSALTGSQNVAIGDQAMIGTTSAGSQNIAIGSSTLNQNTGSYNIGVGSFSIQRVTGSRNVGMGGFVMQNLANGSGNVALGYGVLRNVVNASNQVAVGDSALFTYTGTVGANTVVGSKAGSKLTSGSENTALGFEAMPDALFTNKNVGIGYQALKGLEGGGQNVAVGFGASLKNNIGGGATAIGAEASAGSFNSTAIGYQASVTGLNRMAFGNTDVISWIFGRTTSTANRALEVGTNNTNGNGAYLTTGGTWTNNSDINLKEDITNISAHDILQKIAGMQITRWKYKGTNEYHIGPMAQDFHAAFQTGNDNTSISSIDPAGVALAAIQALIAQNELLTTEIQVLKKQMEQLK